jgi:protoporphyrinogen/coproporphyrinogen III oxidase
VTGVLVVGGGITGLSAARSLALRGIRVTLVEAAGRLGGKATTEHVDGFTIEHGPDSFLAARPEAIDLLRQLGLDGQLIRASDPRIVYIRHRGSLVPIPEGLGLVLPTRLMPLVGSRLFSWPEKLGMAKDAVWPRILGPDDVSVGSFLRARLGSALVDRLAGPLVGGIYGTPIDELSLDAVVPQLRVAERAHRSLLLAGLADGRAMRAAMAAQPAGGPRGAFVSLGGGMSSFVDALEASVRDLGAEVVTGHAVRRLCRAGLGVEASFAGGVARRFDAVILATPAPVAASLLEAELPGAARPLAGIPHGSSIVVTLAYPGRAVARELVGHGYLVPAAEGGGISACTWSSEKWPGRAPDDALLVRLSVRGEDTWTNQPDDALVAAARADVERTLGLSGEPLLVRVARWAGTMPRYTVGHLERLAGIEAAMTAWPAAVLAGASYRGVGLPDCIAQGQAAAARLAERLDGISESRPSPAGAASPYAGSRRAPR